MSDQPAERKTYRRLVLDVFEDGAWELNITPSIPGFVNYEVVGILRRVLHEVEHPMRATTTQGISEGTTDVSED